jgi:hypothetical protein
MIKLNSIPKAGTHLLIRATELLGAVVPNMGHALHANTIKDDRHLFIIRNPRNALISWLRWNKKPLAQGTIITTLQRYEDSVPFYDYWMRYVSWMTAENAMVIRFELLLDDERVLRRIADYLGVAYLDDAYAHLVGPTATYTGRLSRWQEHWTPIVEDAWGTFGGTEIERAFGYVP